MPRYLGFFGLLLFIGLAVVLFGILLVVLSPFLALLSLRLKP